MGRKTEGGNHLMIPLSRSTPLPKLNCLPSARDRSLWRLSSQLSTLRERKGKGRKRRLQIKMEGPEIHEMATNKILAISLEYHSVFHLPNQPAMNNTAKGGVAFLCCL